SLCAVLCFLFYCIVLLLLLFFFFQAEDGIRDDLVTGVQTCALPIFTAMRNESGAHGGEGGALLVRTARDLHHGRRDLARGRRERSEERRVGKECRSRGSPEH